MSATASCAGIAVVLRALRRMADGVLGDQQFAGQPTRASIRSTSTRRVVSGAWAASVPGGSGAGSARPSRIRSIAVDHRLGIAGDQAALQQAFEVRRVQRPAMMAQHVGRDPACRFQAAGGALRRRLGKQQLLRLEKVAADGRQAGRVPGRLVAVAGSRAAEIGLCRSRRVRRSDGRDRPPRHRRRPGISPLDRIRSIQALTWSRQARHRSIKRASPGRCSSGRRTSTSSAACSARPIATKSTMPAAPFSV